VIVCLYHFIQLLGILDLKVPNWAFALWAPFYAFWLILAVPLEIIRILYWSKKGEPVDTKSEE
jgi:hypothetical protein